VIFITKLDQAANSLTDPSPDAGGSSPFLFDELAMGLMAGLRGRPQRTGPLGLKSQLHGGQSQDGQRCHNLYYATPPTGARFTKSAAFGRLIAAARE
jgi:hypothetical protein